MKCFEDVPMFLTWQYFVLCHFGNLTFDQISNQDHSVGIKMLVGIEKAKLPLNYRHLVSISPTFHEQLLRQNPFAKKLQTQIVST
jgi:hypothetical protein